MTLTVYYKQTHPERHLRGMIVGDLNVPAQDVSRCLPEHATTDLEAAKFETQYHDGNGFVERQTVSAEFSRTTASVGETVVLQTLPIPCMLYINTEAVEVDDGTLELTLTEKGTYIVEIQESAYEMKKWVVYAV